MDEFMQDLDEILLNSDKITQEIRELVMEEAFKFRNRQSI